MYYVAFDKRINKAKALNRHQFRLHKETAITITLWSLKVTGVEIVLLYFQISKMLSFKRKTRTDVVKKECLGEKFSLYCQKR